MSENLDLVRAIYAQWERGDYWGGPAQWLDSGLEFVVADGPEPGTWRGRAGAIEGGQIILRAWDELRNEAQEYRELDADRILVLTSFSGRGKTSGLEIRQTAWTGATVFHVRGGRVTKLVLYWDSDRALADLGLEE
jgi:ketosteroid isomerase-like protein